MVVIELGDVGDTDDGASRAPEFRQGTVRRMVLAALVVLCTVALGGSARPAAPLIRPLWSVPFSEIDVMSVTGGVVLVQNFSDGAPDLTAYDAVTGRARWSRPLDGQTTQVDPTARGGVLLMLAEQETAETDLGNGAVSVETFGGTVTAVDAATGGDLWRRPGSYQLAAGPQTILLVEHRRNGASALLRLVRARDGGLIWERALTGPADMSVQFENDQPVRIVTSAKDGLITLFDYATGAPTLSRRLPWISRAENSAHHSSILAVPGVLLENRTTGATGAVVAYRIDTLERLWSISGTTHVWGQACGPMICVIGENQFRVVEPLTGRERWQSTGYPTTGLVPGDRLFLVSDSDADPRPRLAEAATGRAVGRPVRGWLTYWDSTSGFAILLDPLDQEGTRGVVTRFDLATGRSTVLGAIGLTSPHRCTGDGVILACQSADRLVVNAIG